MKKAIVIVAAVLAATAVIFSCTQTDAKATPISQDSLVKRGAYLVTIMSCNDCHTPVKMGPQGPMPDPDRILSGHPREVPVGKFDTATAKNYALFGMTGTSMVGPWGVSFAANITSDETGIGNWDEEQFRRAFTHGKSKGLAEGRDLLPPMPWFNYTNIKDEDLKAIFAYLKSTKPVHNVVPGPIAPNEVGEYVIKK